MPLWPEIKGLKFPDEYVVRFFFKEQMDKKQARVLELGCGNGNNLMLFHEYGWSVFGIDINPGSLANADHNFSIIDEAKRGGYAFLQHDLSRALPKVEGKYDVVLMPGVLEYIPRNAMKKCLMDVSNLLVPGGYFFLRMRALGDYRYGKGRMVELNGFILEIAETGEEGLLNVFYHPDEIVKILHDHLSVDKNSLRMFNLSFDNWQNNTQIATNQEFIIWGKVQ
jgi:SAM-dependent methyltransferase